MMRMRGFDLKLKMKRMMGHTSFRKLCSYSYYVKKARTGHATAHIGAIDCSRLLLAGESKQEVLRKLAQIKEEFPEICEWYLLEAEEQTELRAGELAEEFPIKKTLKWHSLEYFKRMAEASVIVGGADVDRAYIEKESQKLLLLSAPKNEKRIFLYGGKPGQNGISTSLKNLLKHFPLEGYRFYILYRDLSEEELRAVREDFPKGSIFVSYQHMYATWRELFARVGIYIFDHVTSGNLRQLKTQCRRNCRAYLRAVEPNLVMQFTGYDRELVAMFAETECPNVIFVHNDKVAEVYDKKSEKAWVFRELLPLYDYVIPVTADLQKGLETLGVPREKCFVIGNYHDDTLVKQKAELPIEFQEETEATCTLEQLKEALNSGREIFTTIGRFCYEKGHDMLLAAFHEYHKQHAQTILLIIGGYGELFEQTCDRVRELGLEKNVYLIKSVRNPMPILARSSLFVLSSRFEGQGMVVLEAESLGIPIVSTDVNGPHGFMSEHNGTLVKPDAEGILEGMNRFHNHEVQVLGMDFALYNKDNMQRLVTLLEWEEQRKCEES